MREEYILDEYNPYSEEEIEAMPVNEFLVKAIDEVEAKSLDVPQQSERVSLETGCPFQLGR